MSVGAKSQGAHELPITAGGLKPPLHHEPQSSLNGGKPTAFPGQAASGVGGHAPQMGTGLTFTG